jgi:hypothetical protein
MERALAPPPLVLCSHTIRNTLRILLFLLLLKETLLILVIGGQDIEEMERILAPALLRPERCMHFLRPGRLVHVREGPFDWGWGIVVAVHQTPRPKPKVGF